MLPCLLEIMEDVKRL